MNIYQFVFDLFNLHFENIHIKWIVVGLFFFFDHIHALLAGDLIYSYFNISSNIDKRSRSFVFAFTNIVFTQMS